MQYCNYTSGKNYSLGHALEFLQVCSVSVLACVCGREKIREGDDTERQIRISARLNRLMNADKDQLRTVYASLEWKMENKLKSENGWRNLGKRARQKMRTKRKGERLCK